MIDLLISKLLATPEIAALCANRVRPIVREPGDVGPTIVVNDVDSDPDHTHDGRSGLDADLVQLDCYASTWEACDDLRLAVTALLDGARFTHDGVTFQRLALRGRRGSLEPAADRLFRSSLDFAVWLSTPEN